MIHRQTPAAGRPKPRPDGRGPAVLAGAALALGTAGCEVAWGGGRIALEDPAPPPDTTAAADPAAARIVPIPRGPLLYLVAATPDGSSRVVPVAGLAGEPLGASFESLAVPDSADDGYRARFDSVFLSPGLELELHSGGVRLGSLVLTEGGRVVSPACPGVAGGRALLPPGADVPPIAFAIPREVGAGAAPGRPAASEPTRSMAVAGPVLAERLIAGQRAFLARRMALRQVSIPGDTIAGMAATYLIADSMAAGPPAGDAISLFFMARREPRGFVSVWQEVRRYDTPEEKEAFEYLDRLELPAGRVDFLRRYGGTGVRLAASLLPPETAADELGLSWTEPEPCSALELLSP